MMLVVLIIIFIMITNWLSSLTVYVLQESLSSLSQSTLSLELQSYSDVCEALSTVEVALGFLAMTGGEPNMQFGDYLKEELQMVDYTSPHVLKVNKTFCVFQ